MNPTRISAKKIKAARKRAFERLYPEREYPSGLYPLDGVVDWRLPIEEEVYAEIAEILDAQLDHTREEVEDYYRSLTPEKVREEVAQLVRDYANQQLNIVVSAKIPRKPLTSEGIANRINSLYVGLLEEGKK